MILFSSIITPRLQYIAGFVGKELTGQDIQITSDANAYNAYQGIRINYSNERIGADECWLKPHTLLFETDIREQPITCFEINGRKAFFKTEGDFHFDIFAASFYLLSRYEEYLPHQKDAYGRYDYQNSLAYRESFLNQPLVNYWIKDFRTIIEAKFPSFSLYPSSFTFIPTYDIDMAWSYNHKGWWRNFGGFINSMIKADGYRVKERFRVLSGKQKDPFDAYSWMNGLHERYELKPYYFFLVAEAKGKYDKNIRPSVQAMQELIYDHAIRYPIGVHPSWQSGDDATLIKEEKDRLSKITGSEILSSRQHYIRFILPDTFRLIIESGIRFDFSMGYGSINGFRASVASAFYWYDLPNEKQTELLLFPFCFMDANSFYEQQVTAEKALTEMLHYYRVVKEVNGLFTMIWHNTFLGTDKSFIGWKDIYEQFIKEVSA